MDHVAIMKKSWGMTEKILDGRKKIESRWYINKYRPWGTIKRGDSVYFKNSGESVAIKTQVDQVMQFSGLDPARARNILNKYGRDIGIGGTQMKAFFGRIKDKKYCILIFLTQPVAVKPFEIDKTGFGLMSSWIVVEDINKIKKS